MLNSRARVHPLPRGGERRPAHADLTRIAKFAYPVCRPMPLLSRERVAIAISASRERAAA